MAKRFRWTVTVARKVAPVKARQVQAMLLKAEPRQFVGISAPAAVLREVARLVPECGDLRRVRMFDGHGKLRAPRGALFVSPIAILL